MPGHKTVQVITRLWRISDRGECLTLCPLKDSGVVEMKLVCEIREVKGNNVGGLNFLSKGKGEALAGQGILFTNAIATL